MSGYQTRADVHTYNSPSLHEKRCNACTQGGCLPFTARERRRAPTLLLLGIMPKQQSRRGAPRVEGETTMTRDKQLEARIDAYIEEAWPSVIADIKALVAHPSVADAARAEPGAPFGPEARAALDCALKIARRLGYETGDDDGYLGWADIPGEREGQVATIAHVDVVPAGPGWTGDPFKVRQRDGWLIGRGVLDDKGPAVLSLYAGAFMLREGIRPRYTFRALLGSDEEVGMTDVHHYLETHEHPLFLFTPDADFPVCNAEKGLFDASFVSAPIEGGRILAWSGAEATNAIPSESVCELAVDAADLPAPEAHADRITIEQAAPGVARITAHGIGGHASMPAGTVNAVGLIVGYLGELAGTGVLTADEERALELLAAVHADTAGEAMGIASSDEAFGPLTANAGVISVADGRIRQSLDCRFPGSTSAEVLEETLTALAARFGATLEVDMTKPPFSVGADHPAVQTLLDVYSEVTGRAAKPFSMGGGTYARNFKRAVSFGPEDPRYPTPSWIGSVHGPDEGANEELLRRALKMYIMAIVRLMELDLD